MYRFFQAVSSPVEIIFLISLSAGIISLELKSVNDLIKPLFRINIQELDVKDKPSEYIVLKENPLPSQDMVSQIIKVPYNDLLLIVYASNCATLWNYKKYTGRELFRNENTSIYETKAFIDYRNSRFIFSCMSKENKNEVIIIPYAE